MHNETIKTHALLLVAIADESLRLQLLEGLPNHGWRVLTAASSAEVPALLLQHHPAALMVDPGIELPEMILESFRIPCVALLPQQEEAAAVGLMRDRLITMCFTPPFNLDWLAASLSALVRLCRGENSREGRWFYPRTDEAPDAWILFAGTWTLQAPGGESIRLSQTETTFIAALAHKPGQAVSRREMVEALGHDMEYFDLRRLDTLVSRLRVKVNNVSSITLPVRSIHAVGYAFVAPIHLED
ncbi:winged helix-turn-helix domain-containing protein [Dechloromonas sp. ZS-1]|uniref:response regulator transcription factor n=1 Tax=Dechloromonas sp. ZS-1 TaxID=3138067 RepID=UPI0031FC9D13